MGSWLRYRDTDGSSLRNRSEGDVVKLLGWVFSKRIHGDKTFIMLRDRYGYIQIVGSKNLLGDKYVRFKEINVESAIAVEGIVRFDPRAPDGVEIHVTDFSIIAGADVWPITRSALKAPGFMYDKRHLTIRGPRSRAILLLRSIMVQAAFEYFIKNDYVFITAPTFITAAVEGGATLFELKYFDKKAYLTQSSQFYEEAAICTFERVFVIQPSFRAEKSRTRKHLTEFLHIEAEVAFADHGDIMDIEEELLKYIINRMNELAPKEIKFLRGGPLPIYEDRFERISYDEAIQILQGKGFNINWGDDFGADDERALCKEFDKPFFVTGFPREIRSFYHMDDPSRPEVTLSSDLMAPEGYGEITSGGQRIHDYESLYRKIIEMGLKPDDYEWYLEIRKYGMPPHSGFGMGVERVLRWLLRLPHIRDSTLFPRTPSRLHP